MEVEKSGGKWVVKGDGEMRVMKMKIKPKKILFAQAIHEASHAVAHYFLGLRFNYIQIYEPPMGGELRRYKPFRIHGNKEKAEKEIIISLCSVEAELKYFGKGDPKLTRCIFEACDSDLGIAYDLCQAYFSKKSAFNRAKYSELFNKARELVTNNYQTIEALAKELVVKKRMGYKKCVEIIVRATRLKNSIRGMNCYDK